MQAEAPVQAVDAGGRRRLAAIRARRPPRWSGWRGVAVAVLGALLALQLASRIFDLDLGLGDEAGTAIADWSYRALMAASALLVALRAALVAEQRAAWALIAVGLVAWTAGDVYYELLLSGDEIPYPSLSDALYFVLYGALIAGMRLLRGSATVSLALIVVLLGLTTLWSWLVLSEVLDGAVGGTAAVLTTVAYPLLDLALVASTLLALAARGGRSAWVFGALGAGFLVMALGDSVYAVQVAQGVYTDGTLLEAVWPAGALCIAAAAWIDPGKDHHRAERDGRDRAVEALTAVAIAMAMAILFVDHFARVDTVTVFLAGATLFAALVHRAMILHDHGVAQAAVDAAATLRSASAEAALDCIISIDGAGRVSEWNDAAARTFGYARSDAVGVDLADLIIPPQHRAQHRRGLTHVAETGEGRILNSQIEVMAMHADGSELPVELMITQVRVDPPMFTGFLRDISERRRRTEENERLAEIVRSSENAIISKDLDGVIYAWNSGAERLYGYTAEEAIGKPLGQLIVPHEHADEMASMTRGVLDGESAGLETQRRRKSGELVDVSLRAFAIRNLADEIVGVCTSAHDITDRRQREERDRRDETGRQWRGRIETALTDGLFMFWGQPVVDASTGATDHHELLLRMDLDGDVITPNHFLPHAEDCDLITEIDRFAITTGFEIAETIPVAINLSARSLEDPRLVTDIKEVLGTRALAPNVVFEITESAAVKNLDAARELVDELTALGFGVALDDFGTGYGSFTYLQQLAVTELKIDIGFVRGLAEDPSDQRLVKSIIAVARNFDMKTVAEGVEDQATLDLLRTLGVDFVQGYHIGYPAQMTASRRWAPVASAPPGLVDQTLAQRLGDR
jgi:PAS domain S-box-containing protein